MRCLYVCIKRRKRKKLASFLVFGGVWYLLASMASTSKETLLQIPDDVMDEAKSATYNLLPSKSKLKYEKMYQDFDNWRKTKGVQGLNEDILLAYFFGLAKNYKASSMWSKYSMLKATLKVFENVDISRFMKLTAYLKGQTRTYKPKKANVFEREDIEKFFVEAPDEKYLLMKVALLFGVSGACRCEELIKLTIDDIVDKDSYLHIKIPDTKTNKPRSFTVISEGYSVKVLDIYKKYRLLRPKNVPHQRFFLNYQNQKCTVQAVGINTISRIPRLVASFLKLSQPETYTGHCYRRSSATLLVNAGGDLTALKRHGGWMSASVAEGYIAESLPTKLDAAKKILKGNESKEYNEPIAESARNVCEEIPQSSRRNNKPLNDGIDLEELGNTNICISNVEVVNFYFQNKNK